MERKSSFLFSNIEQTSSYENTASKRGITVKTGMLLILTIVVGLLSGFYFYRGAQNGANLNTFYGLLIGSSIEGFIAVMLGRISYRFAMPASVVYSISEGLLLGVVVTIVDAGYPGIGLNAALATMVVFGVMLLCYRANIIKVNQRFVSIMKVFTIGLLVMLILNVILSFTLLANVQVSWGLMAVIDAVLLAYGAFSILLNFAEADAVVAMGADKNAEWSVALGLEVTVIYMFIRMLRILQYFSRN